MIDGYLPVGVDDRAWEASAATVRAWVRAAGPSHRRRALQLLYAAAHLAVWCRSEGIPGETDTALRETTVERFCAWAQSVERFSPTTRATIRARLRHLAAVNRPRGAAPPPTVLPRARVRPPYTDPEVDSYLRLARNQPTLDRRRRLLGLLCAGLGAGCGPEDLRWLTGTDVTADGDVTWVTIKGKRPRRVPVLRQYSEELRWAADASGAGLLVGGRKPDRRSVTTVVLHRVAGGLDLPPLEPGRLRSTWLTAQLRNGVRLDVVMAAGGLSTAASLADLVGYLPEPAPADRLTLTGPPPPAGGGFRPSSRGAR